MKFSKALLLALAISTSTACSLPPETQFKKDQLYKTGIYTYFTVNDSPESVLAAINKEGEVVLDALYKKRPVWIKLLGKRGGITVQVIER